MKWNIKQFDTLLSTNQTAQEYPENTVIQALEQTGGRGRYGNKWNSPKGNLYMSVVLKDYGADTPLFAFIVATSVAEALADFDVRIKWPNDILMSGAKLCGILLEKENDKLIVGIGVNVVSHPTEGLLYQATDLNGALSADEVRDQILTALSQNITLFEQSGFTPIRRKWIERAVGMGSQIKVRLPNETLTGIFKDLSQSGALILELPDKTIKEITAGVVFLME